MSFIVIKCKKGFIFYIICTFVSRLKIHRVTIIRFLSMSASKSYHFFFFFLAILRVTIVKKESIEFDSYIRGYL